MFAREGKRTGGYSYDEFEVGESVELNDAPNSSNGGIVLGPETYVVGEDIDAGKYDCVAISGFGVCWPCLVCTDNGGFNCDHW